MNCREPISLVPVSLHFLHTLLHYREWRRNSTHNEHTVQQLLRPKTTTICIFMNCNYVLLHVKVMCFYMI